MKMETTNSYEQVRIYIIKTVNLLYVHVSSTKCGRPRGGFIQYIQGVSRL